MVLLLNTSQAGLALQLSFRVAEESAFSSLFPHDPEEINARVRLVEYFGGKTYLTIVEYGAGCGETTFSLCKRGHSLYALEDDLALFSVLSSNSSFYESTTPVILPISAVNSEFKDEIDVVFAFNYFSFLNFENKALVIQKAFESLRTEGVLIFSHSNIYEHNELIPTSQNTFEVQKELKINKKLERSIVLNPNTINLQYKTELVFRNEVIKSVESESRLYLSTPKDLIDICARVGFENAWVFNDLSLNSNTPDSFEYFIVARK